MALPAVFITAAAVPPDCRPSRTAVVQYDPSQMPAAPIAMARPAITPEAGRSPRLQKVAVPAMPSASIGIAARPQRPGNRRRAQSDNDPPMNIPPPIASVSSVDDQRLFWVERCIWCSK